MYLLPGNPFSHAVEAYRDSGDSAMCKPLASPRTRIRNTETCFLPPFKFNA